jgi:hypothetical protein
MNAAPDLEALAGSPGWFPFQLDLAADRVLMVAKSEADVRAAGFLDQRSLDPAAPRVLASWSALAAPLAAARREADYIFHIGHVGSTLLSRLLGELETVLALREPLILRSLAEAFGMAGDGSGVADFDTAAALLSRAFRPGQRALVKATSFTSEVADRLVQPGARAIFLYVSPRRYIETILAGEGSRQELAILTPSRLARLATRCPGLEARPEALSEARKAALSWACEMTSLERSAQALGDRVMWLDFDAFLEAPARQLAAAAAFLRHPAEPARIEALAAGPLMRRYSKALEYEYSPELRQALLAEARGMHGRSIDAAVEHLVEAGRRWPAVGAALRRAGEEV